MLHERPVDDAGGHDHGSKADDSKNHAEACGSCRPGTGRVDHGSTHPRGRIGDDALSVQMDYPNRKDHLVVLREKTGRLRVEIAEIQELNKQYRRQGRDDVEAQVAHGQRQERLQAIQEEFTQIAALGRKVHLIDEMKEKHHFRLHSVKKAS